MTFCAEAVKGASKMRRRRDPPLTPPSMEGKEIFDNSFNIIVLIRQKVINCSLLIVHC
jgi:hypothetical protein